jgi:transposase-like protein
MTVPTTTKPVAPALAAETQGARRATEVSAASAGGAAAATPAAAVVASLPDPEVVEKRRRRRFTATDKQRILAEADACAPGQLGALLRREGLYSSNLTTWRQQREAGILAGLAACKRGPKTQAPDPQAERIAVLERECERLRQRLMQAETIIDVQKKVSLLLGLDPTARTGSC